MLKIISIQENAIANFPFLMVLQGGERSEEGKRKVAEVLLEIQKGYIEGLPEKIDALIVTSDLQGGIIENEKSYLLGEKLPDFLASLLTEKFPTLDKAKIMVILCGDLYATLDKRGGLGDVKNVWRKFKEHFANVVGVAGNHDDFGEQQQFESFKREKGIVFLQKETKKVENIEISGISGIIGQSDKPNRVEKSNYLAILKKILLKQTDVVLLHQSPDYPNKSLDGEPEIRKVIENSPKNLIFCGHRNWNIPLVEFQNGSQVMNVDKRVVILLNSKFLQNI